MDSISKLTLPFPGGPSTTAINALKLARDGRRGRWEWGNASSSTDSCTKSVNFVPFLGRVQGMDVFCHYRNVQIHAYTFWPDLGTVKSPSDAAGMSTPRVPNTSLSLMSLGEKDWHTPLESVARMQMSVL